MRGAQRKAQSRAAPRIVLGRLGDDCPFAPSDWSLGSEGRAGLGVKESRLVASTVAPVGVREPAHAGRVSQ